MIKSQSHAMEVQNLTIKFANVTAVNSVDLNVSKGRIVGIVGESGSGKSTLASALIGLLPNSARVTAGKVLFGNNNIVPVKPDFMRSIRGSSISLVSQDTLSALNPVLTIGEHLIDIQFREKLSLEEKR